MAKNSVAYLLGVSMISGLAVADSLDTALGVCAVHEIKTDDSLWQISDMHYIGGFRVSAAQHGPNNASTTNYSRAIFTLSESGDSIFISGEESEGQIAEFEIPAIVNTSDLSQMNIAQPIQSFSLFDDPSGRYDPGIGSYLRQTGMLAIDGKLIVNYYNWYDATGTETDTTAVFQDSSDLANTSIVGPFQLDGAARSAGWISELPTKWKQRMDATHVSGWSQGSINSRLSNGPSAYFWNPSDALDTTTPAAITADAGLNFPLEGILYDKTKYTYDGTFGNNEILLMNNDLNNDLWTYLSGASYGFVVPGTDTYMTVGFSGGHNAGIGYKVLLPSGAYSSGHAPLDGEDYNDGYYWLWDMKDIEAAKNGSTLPQDVRPYDWGPFQPFELQAEAARIASGSFDANSGKLYLSLAVGDKTGNYSRPPLFVVYQIN